MKNLSVFGMCLNWKVLAGLAVVGLGVALYAPGLALSALPLLLVLACPLSCLLMMRRGGQGGQGNQGMACCAPGASSDTQMDQERSPSVVALTPDERLAEVRFQLDALQNQQEAILRELATLEAAEGPLPAEPSAAADDERSLISSGR